MIKDEFILSKAKDHDSFYIYDGKAIGERAELLKAAFPGVEFLYSVKCNPFPEVVRTLANHDFGMDAASIREVELAIRAGIPGGNIFYSAPGKTTSAIRKALRRSMIIADSLSEITRISQVVRAEPLETGIRVNPDFSMDGDEGMPSKFGIDEKEVLHFLKDDVPENLRITGLHVHLKSQVLDEEKLLHYYDKLLDMASKFAPYMRKFSFLNLGSGIGIPYGEENPLDIRSLGQKLAGKISLFHEKFPETRLLIETGRYVTGPAGIYVTKVVDRKVSHGKTFLILADTLNGFLRPSMGEIVRKYGGENAPGSEPLFTKTHAFPIRTLKNGDLETVTLAGSLCTASDMAAEDISLPHLEIGDPVIFENAGAYGATLSPFAFSSKEKPAEYFVPEFEEW